MNTYGFTISSGTAFDSYLTNSSPFNGENNIASQKEKSQGPTNTKTEEEIYLEKYFLTWSAIENSQGYATAEHILDILRAIEDEGNSTNLRVSLASALLTWQSLAPPALKEHILTRHYYKTLEVIKFILLETSNSEIQRAAELLALWIQREATQSIAFATALFHDLSGALSYIAKQGDLDTAIGSPIILDDNDSAGLLRAKTIIALIRSLPIITYTATTGPTTATVNAAKHEDEQAGELSMLNSAAEHRSAEEISYPWTKDLVHETLDLLFLLADVYHVVSPSLLHSVAEHAGSLIVLVHDVRLVIPAQDLSEEHLQYLSDLVATTSGTSDGEEDGIVSGAFPGLLRAMPELATNPSHAFFHKHLPQLVQTHGLGHILTQLENLVNTSPRILVDHLTNLLQHMMAATKKDALQGYLEILLGLSKVVPNLVLPHLEGITMTVDHEGHDLEIYIIYYKIMLQVGLYNPEGAVLVLKQIARLARDGRLGNYSERTLQKMVPGYVTESTVNDTSNGTDMTTNDVKIPSPVAVSVSAKGNVITTASMKSTMGSTRPLNTVGASLKTQVADTGEAAMTTTGASVKPMTSIRINNENSNVNSVAMSVRAGSPTNIGGAGAVSTKSMRNNAVGGTSSKLAATLSQKQKQQQQLTLPQLDPTTKHEIRAGAIGLINVVKDICLYSNLLHPDTIVALTAMQDSDSVTVENILKWNRGERARRGKKDEYLKLLGSLHVHSVQKTVKKHSNGRTGCLNFGGSSSNNNQDERGGNSNLVMPLSPEQEPLLLINAPSLSSGSTSTRFSQRPPLVPTTTSNKVSTSVRPDLAVITTTATSVRANNNNGSTRVISSSSHRAIYPGSANSVRGHNNNNNNNNNSVQYTSPRIGMAPVMETDEEGNNNNNSTSGKVARNLFGNNNNNNNFVSFSDFVARQGNNSSNSQAIISNTTSIKNNSAQQQQQQPSPMLTWDQPIDYTINNTNYNGDYNYNNNNNTNNMSVKSMRMVSSSSQRSSKQQPPPESDDMDEGSTEPISGSDVGNAKPPPTTASINNNNNSSSNNNNRGSSWWSWLFGGGSRSTANSNNNNDGNNNIRRNNDEDANNNNNGFSSKSSRNNNNNNNSGTNPNGDMGWTSSKSKKLNALVDQLPASTVNSNATTPVPGLQTPQSSRLVYTNNNTVITNNNNNNNNSSNDEYYSNNNLTNTGNSRSSRVSTR